MLPISGSRKIAGITKQIGQTAEYIEELCENIDDTRCDCASASWEGDNDEAIEEEHRYLRKLRALTRQVKRRTTLGGQLNEEIHKAS